MTEFSLNQYLRTGDANKHSEYHGGEQQTGKRNPHF
jgi:hypothetical protein